MRSLIIIAALVTASAAHAEAERPAPSGGVSLRPAAESSGARLSLSRAVFALPYGKGAGGQEAGPPRTAIDHRFAADGVVGQVGYLCGIHSFPPGSSRDGGPPSAFGHQGTFLGAKLALAFR